ncbi:GNAT family N-acetyltransferase [Tsuneonella sp. CC-YZS046]|uniref:GNAT family N-acetyltransferase n=1 Tax=Tsuneonella sp. CC-YZS046 TaxID=3042152 RepID=UPI002D79C947|nr:GNAT family N-acetyltransferase [Tsuneonella sp. CC-YZS046]WRO66036.1 GNAT family N-acetyltransferase [Tsuneonella sp. CC-YZS046]
MAVRDDALRDMAQHRGFKLLKSRRRKPGVGDYGKFGLTDATGKPLLGMGDEGLTASAADVEAYLRKSALGTWKQSAETTPDRPLQAKKARAAEPDDEESPIRRKSAGRGEAGAGPQRRKAARPPQGRPDLRLVPKTESPPNKPEAVPEPEPELAIRQAKPGDADALSALLGGLSDGSVNAEDIAGNLAAIRKAKGGMVVAEKGAIIGCCAWAVVPTVQRGETGRITLLLVDKAHRRRGIGSSLLAAAEAALKKAGCREVEVMSHIAIANSHNFFRSLKFEQASYRFVRAIGSAQVGERVPRGKD